MLNIDQLKYDYYLIGGVSCVKYTAENKIYWHKNESNKKDQWLFLEDIKHKRFWYDSTFETNICMEYNLNSEYAKLFITEFIKRFFNINNVCVRSQRDLYIVLVEDTLVEAIQEEIDRQILKDLRGLK